MLVYLREDVRRDILKPPTLDEIPSELKTAFDAENEIIDSMSNELEVHNECGFVFLISQEIIQSQFLNEETKIVELPISIPTN